MNNADEQTLWHKQTIGFGKTPLLFLIFSLELLLLLALSSCRLPGSLGLLPSVSNRPIAATKTTSLTAIEPIMVTHRPYLTAEAWFDITSSVYPSSYFTRTVQSVASAIDQSVQPNEDGATIYIGLINHNSFRSESTVMVITIPPLSADPPQPKLLPQPLTTGNPIKDSQNQQKVTNEENKTLATWQQILFHIYALLAQVQKHVKQQTNQLRHLSPAVDNQATDIHGALDREDAISGSSSRDEIPYPGTDLEKNTSSQDIGNLKLPGVHAKIIFHPCEDAATCQANDTYWRHVLSMAGVRDISILDPVQSQTLQNLFS